MARIGHVPIQRASDKHVHSSLGGESIGTARVQVREVHERDPLKPIDLDPDAATFEWCPDPVLAMAIAISHTHALPHLKQVRFLALVIVRDYAGQYAGGRVRALAGIIKKPPLHPPRHPQS